MAAELESELNIKDYLAIIKRRWVPMAVVFFIGWIVITIVGFKIPPVYRASGLISIDSPKISKGLIGGNIGQLTAAKYVDEQVDRIKRQILSRENLEHLNNKYKLFPKVKKPSDLPSTLGEKIEFSTDTRSVDGTAWAQKVTVGFNLAFEHSDPEKTYNVTNDLIKQIIDFNVKERTERATETTKFLTEELNRLKSELEVVEDKVADFKQKNADALPEHQDMHMNSLDQLRKNLQDLDIEYKSTQEELRYLDVELTTANANLNKMQGALGTDTAVSELDKAKEELNNALAAYKETHPTVRALRRKVALLEEQESPEKQTVTTRKAINPAAELAIAKISSQIEAAKVRQSSISQEKKNLRRQIANINRQVLKIPQVERELVKLLRDYDNAKAKYEEVKAKQVNAKIAEDLEKDNKSEKFTLIESPVFPEYRINLSKTKISIYGFLGSLGLGLGIGFLMEALDKRVRGQSKLSMIIDDKPIAVIPYIYTQEEITKRKIYTNWFVTALISFVLLVLVVLIVHFFITPLDDYVSQVKGLINNILS